SANNVHEKAGETHMKVAILLAACSAMLAFFGGSFQRDSTPAPTTAVPLADKKPICRTGSHVEEKWEKTRDETLKKIITQLLDARQVEADGSRTPKERALAAQRIRHALINLSMWAEVFHFPEGKLPNSSREAEGTQRSEK